MTNNQEARITGQGRQATSASTPLPPHPEIAASDAPSALPHDSKPRGRDYWEQGYKYPGIIFHIPDTPWRVSVCPQGRQWVLQRGTLGKNNWQSQKFFARKQRLAAVIKTLCGETAYSAVADKVQALPI